MNIWSRLQLLKVKMSLKIFAACTQRQKEEERAGISAGTSMEAPPVVKAVGLVAGP
jgi:hypothetical protein